jgi:protoporphyrinogen oxidase
VSSCVVIGAGPAGLTAAYELSRLGHASVVLEGDDIVGGISRTHVYKGYRFDIGGHRFFTKVGLVQDLWEEILGDEMLVRSRLSRIYYEGRFFDYPLKPFRALRGLGPLEAFRIALSYAAAQVVPSREEKSFEQWVSNRFGRRLFEIFFEAYTEKVWGIPCSEISADWAAQRIQNLDLASMLKRALIGSKTDEIATLIERFHYPRHGPGQMWERCAALLEERGTSVLLRTRVERISHDGRRVKSVTVRGPDGAEREMEAERFLSSMPIRDLLHALDPAPPKEVMRAADQLRYRDFLTVGLIVDRAELFPDNWIYVHSGDVKLGRIQNFKNWSPQMVPDPEKTSLGLEYFVQENDELWCASDEELIELGTEECQILGLVAPGEVLDGTVIRMPKAYPVYDGEYQAALAIIREALGRISNLELIGRNGQHRYNNQDHSMLTGVLAARNIATGSQHDVWSVNVSADYHEEASGAEGQAGGDRLVPGPAPAETLEGVVASAFARYDAVALGTALGTVAGLGLFLATAVLLMSGEGAARPMLSLLGNYFFGYTVSWSGAALGLFEAGLGGFVFGLVLARLLNLVIGAERKALERRIEMNQITLGGGEP